MQERPVETTLYSLADAPPEADERRDGDRHLTLFRVGAMMIGERRELCLIKNISAGGMRIRAYCMLEVGTRLSVELKCGEPVEGTARWVDGDSVGIAFDHPIDVIDLLSSSMDGPRPRMPRVAIDCAALIREGATTRRIHARDISQGGLKLLCEAPLPKGAEVVVTLPGLEPLPGVVRWQEGEAFGITFNRVLPLPRLVAWIGDQRERLRRAS